MAIVITNGNNKGGVTKTFGSMQIGATLSEYGFKVLLIDFDPQGNLSNNFNLKDIKSASISEVILDKANIFDAIKNTYREGLDIVTADLRLMSAEDSIKLDSRRSDNRLKRALKPVIDEGGYDFIIIDNSPNASTLFVNSLTVSDYVLVPVEADINSLEGYELIDKKIKEVKEDSNPNLEILGITVSKMERTNLHTEYYNEIKEAFGDLVFETTIPKSVVASESLFEKKALIDYSPKHKVTEAYKNLVNEIVEKIG